MKRTATVIGAGPNGLAAAIVLAQAGLDVELHEAAAEVGGAARSGELTLPGFVHDLGSAVYPLGIASPFFATLPLQKHGLEWIQPRAALAHPLDDGTAVMLEREVGATAAQFGAHGSDYRELFQPLVDRWPTLVREVFRPLRFPHHPFLLGRFGVHAIQPATVLARETLKNARAQALFGGIAAHSALKLQAPLSAAFGLILGAAGHAVGWPIASGGAQRIPDALAGVLSAAGGRILTGSRIGRLSEVGKRDLILCNVTPRQLVEIAGAELPGPYRESLEQYRYGPGVFKMDWALSEPIPWRAKECRRAATVHLGGSLEEMRESETRAAYGEAPERPFVLLSQPSLFDATRAPGGRHTAWAYCHVPHGWRGSAVAQIETQIERFAPGFRDCVLARAAHGPPQMQAWNENLVGGDVIGGVTDAIQFALRPTWRRYRTPVRGLYLCSASTPPGGSVHGMCGYYAAQWALKDLKRS
ncbi:MAG TPA: NAD(P)/FAD-dependent oxidoreductase [Bryobacteraceae bacterium]|jgi:phytoene dehydrogenase-like protein|nr:NAD(P)/FAD-dependent oxidoreductase [Bryobacteraceae bacterium]